MKLSNEAIKLARVVTSEWAQLLMLCYDVWNRIETRILFSQIKQKNRKQKPWKDVHMLIPLAVDLLLAITISY